MKPMQKHLWIAILLLVGIGIIVACTPTEEDNGPLPTQPFQPVEEPVVEVLATSDTLAEEITITPIVLITPTPQGPRPLPSTWTPIPPTPTETFVPTLDVGGTWMASTAAPAATINPGCTVFNLDPSRTINTVTLGQSPTLAWTPATGAVLYRVYVYNARGDLQLHEELVEGTTIVVNKDVFRSVDTYVWTVAPLDAFGIQMCTELGDAIIITRS